MATEYTGELTELGIGEEVYEIVDQTARNKITNHTHNYAGSSTAGGIATSAKKLDTGTVGSATQPVYFSGGIPVKCSYTLGKSVPSTAVFTDTVYTHPTTSGYKHIPSGGSSGQILRWSADGTAVWGADNNTTYSVATTTTAGLMSAADKTKLDGIATGANKYTYTLPTASSSTLGGVKIGYTASGKNYPVQLNSSNQMYVNVPWTNTTYDLSKYLPLAGGTMTGNLYIDAGSNNKDIKAMTIYKNGNGTVGIGTSATGRFGIIDFTNDEWIIRKEMVNEDLYRNIYIGSTNYAGYDTTIYGDTVSFPGSYIESNRIYSYNTASYMALGNSISICITDSLGIAMTESGNFRPKTTKTVNCGSPSYRWSNVYYDTSGSCTSDRNLKDNITPLTELHKQLFMKLVPVSFTFNYGTSGRTHVGFISQDVEDAMTELGMSSLDFAGFCKDVKMKDIEVEVPATDKEGKPIYNDDGSQKMTKYTEEVPDLDEDGNEQYIYSLRYEEFIGIIAYVLQDTINEFEEYKTNTNNRLEKLESALQ